MEQTIGNHTFKGWNAGHAKQKLDKLSGVRGFTLHDLRRTGSTKLAELGIAPHVIERILAHKTGTISGVAAVYNRFHFLPEMRDALQKWEAGLHALLQTTEGRNG
jgi:integrase